MLALHALLLPQATRADDRPVAAPDGTLALHKHASILEDEKRAFSIDEVTRPPLAGAFTADNGRLPDLGGTHSGFWLRVWPELNASGGEWIIHVSQTELDRLCLFVPVVASGYQQQCTGLDARRAGKFDGMRDYLLDIPANLDDDRPWYIYAHSNTWLAIPLELMTRQTYLTLDHRYQYLWGLYYGAYFAVVAFALFIFLALRNRTWLFFALHYCALGFGFLALQGRPMDFDFTGNIWWVTRGSPFFMSLFVAFGALFYRGYLNTATLMPRTDKALMFVACGGFLIALLALFSPMWAFQTLGLAGVLFVILVIGAAVKLGRGGQRSGYYALAALGLMLLVGGIKSIEVLGVELLPPEPSLNLFRFLALIGALVLVTGFADRVLLLQKERDLAARENEQRRQALEQSNAELRRFTYIASHDLKQPLRGIAGFAQLLRKRYAASLDDHASEYIGFITDGATHAHDMIDGLLELSLARDSTARREMIDSAALVQASRRQLAAEFAGQDVHFEIADGLPVIHADREQMQKLFHHLLENALKHAGATRDLRIRVSGSATPQGWTFSVTDNGPGVPANQREKIFELFYRIDREQQHGTGLGLAVCKRIVAQHGGHIHVEPGPAGGARFCFTIRRYEPD